VINIFRILRERKRDLRSHEKLREENKLKELRERANEAEEEQRILNEKTRLHHQILATETSRKENKRLAFQNNHPQLYKLSQGIKAHYEEMREKNKDVQMFGTKKKEKEKEEDIRIF